MRTRWAVVTIMLISWVIFAAESSPRKVLHLPADNPMAKLKAGPGVEKVQAYCSICHSTDYIVRQPLQDEKQWLAEVKKMVTVFGAPVPSDDVAAVARYLATAYGLHLNTSGKDGGGNVR